MNTEGISNNKKSVKIIEIESKHGFLKTTSFKKKIQKKLWFWVNKKKRIINTTKKIGIIKKHKLIPQAIHILVYKNAIANG